MYLVQRLRVSVSTDGRWLSQERQYGATWRLKLRLAMARFRRQLRDSARFLTQNLFTLSLSVLGSSLNDARLMRVAFQVVLASNLRFRRRETFPKHFPLIALAALVPSTAPYLASLSIFVPLIANSSSYIESHTRMIPPYWTNQRAFSDFQMYCAAYCILP